MERAIVRNLVTNIDRSELISAEKHIKTFLIVWLIGEVSSENISQQNESHNNLKLFVGLQNIKQRVYKYHNVEKCIKKLHKKSTQRIFLVISDDIPLNDEDNSILCSLPQVDSIYQFGSEMPWKKIGGEVINNDSQQPPPEEEASPFSVLSSSDVTISIEDQDIKMQVFVMEQLLVELLFHLTSGNEGKKDFVNFCRDTYQHDDAYMNEIDRFEKEYIENKAIWWYTGETFVYRILSKTFGSSDLNSIYKIRFFIYELYSELKELSRLQLPTLLKTSLNVFRGVSIPKTDFDCLRRSFGKLVISNSFLSTSTKKDVAAGFTAFNSSAKDSVSVVFCMKINVQKNTSKPIASIKDHSQIQDEDEVLLSIGIVFRIVSSRQLAKNKWEIDLVRGTEEEQFEKNFYTNLPTAEINALITMVAFVATINTGQDFVKYSGNLVAKLNSTYAIPNHTGIEENVSASHNPAISNISQAQPSDKSTSWWTNVTHFAHQHPAIVAIATAVIVVGVVLVTVLPIVLQQKGQLGQLGQKCQIMFPNQTTFPTGATPSSVAVGDFNNDNRLDIAVANYGNNNIGILLGYGNGNFANQTTFTAGSSPSSVVTGDFNNDNRLDIAVINVGSNTVGVLLGYGDGTFASQMTFPTGSSYTPSLAVGDLNNDNQLDIAVADYVNSMLSVFFGYGNGTFSSQIISIPASTPWSVAVGDFNNDNRLDIVVTNYFSDSVGIFLGIGNGSFNNQTMFSTSTTSRSQSVVVGDFNSDSRLDIVVANSGSVSVTVLLGYGNGAFASPSTYLVGSGPLRVAIGDFNKDHVLDITVANSISSNIGVLLGSGNGAFTSQTTSQTGSCPISVAVGDFNNDNRLDIAFTNNLTSTVGILLNAC